MITATQKQNAVATLGLFLGIILWNFISPKMKEDHKKSFITISIIMAVIITGVLLFNKFGKKAPVVATPKAPTN